MADRPPENNSNTAGTAGDYQQQHETVTSTARISMVLRPLMEKHAIITATLPDCNRFFNTTLLSIDTRNSTLVIDELHPKEGHALFLQRKRVTLRTTHDGIDINFTVNLKNTDSENGIAFYAVEFPESIRYLQRRNAFRVPVSAAKAIAVEVQTPDQKTFAGQLNDISAEGMCIRFSKKKQLELSNYSEETQCCIHLPDKRKIRCAFKVCHSTYFEVGNSLHIGGHFENLDKIQRRTIERFVVELQRLLRKNAAG